MIIKQLNNLVDKIQFIQYDIGETSLNLGCLEDSIKFDYITNNLILLFKNYIDKLHIVNEVSEGKTLLVGEGNLSFSYNLTLFDEIIPYNLTTSIFPSFEETCVITKQNAKALTKLGVRVLDEIDATNLEIMFADELFDTIIFQFPHTGNFEFIGNESSNFILIRDFLLSAKSYLSFNGKILVTTVDTDFYNRIFQFDKASEITGFCKPTKYIFDPDQFPVYKHTMTNKDESATRDYEKFATWEFKLTKP